MENRELAAAEGEGQFSVSEDDVQAWDKCFACPSVAKCHLGLDESWLQVDDNEPCAIGKTGGHVAEEEDGAANSEVELVWWNARELKLLRNSVGYMTFVSRALSGAGIAHALVGGLPRQGEISSHDDAVDEVFVTGAPPIMRQP